MFTFIVLIALSNPIFATENWSEDYGVTHSQEAPFPEKYRWLYEVLMPQSRQQQLPDETEKSFKVHTFDTHKEFPHPSYLKEENLLPLNYVEGRITYAGIVKKKYKYDVIKKDDDLILRIKIHFKNPLPSDQELFSKLIEEAQDIWNSQRIVLDFPYNFQFQIVEDAKMAHFSLRIKDSTRGPYDTVWGRDWSSAVVAHEIGHMLGLGDEYQTITGKMDCLPGSLMCACWRGDLMYHHYYFVLRRLMKKDL